MNLSCPDMYEQAELKRIRRKNAMDAVKEKMNTVLGSFWKENVESRKLKPAYVIRPIDPYFCRETGEAMSNYFPHQVIARALGDNVLPPYVYLQTIDAKKESIEAVFHENRSANGRAIIDIVRSWCPGCPVQEIEQWKNNRTKIKRYLELLSSVCRLEILQKLREKVESNEVSIVNNLIKKAEVVRNIAILQDTHQIKLLYMEDFGTYSDIDLNQPDSMYKKYPMIYEDGLHAVIHEGSLPDLASIQSYLPFWDKTCETTSRTANPFDNDPFSRAILRIFTKAIFQPSKVREIHKSLYEELEPQYGDARSKCVKPNRRRLVSFFSRLILCSLLGMYSHADFIPDFHSRKEIYRWLSYSVPTIRDMQNWFLEHKLLITFILRENHIFTLRNIPGLERVFEELYEYFTLRTLTEKSMDTVRTKLSNNIAKTQEFLEQLYAKKLSEGMSAKDVADWRRYVNRRQFVIRCALLMNSGETIYHFVSRFGSREDDPRMIETVRHVFWKFIHVQSFDGVVKHFNNDANVEHDFRYIIIYWLLLRDCCHQSSRIQTRLEYERCYKECGNVQLVAPLPSKYKNMTSYINIRDMALQSQKRLHENFKCAHTNSGDLKNSTNTNCKCLRRIVDSLVGNFDVHRLLDPDIAYKSADASVANSQGLEKYLAAMYTSCLNFCYRPRLSSFAEEIVSSCGTVRNLFANPSILSKNIRCSVEEAVKYIERFENSHKYYKERRTTIREYISRVVNHFEPSSEIGIDWMIRIFKIKVETVLEMDEAFRAMWTETNHRCPYNVIFDIAKKRPYDFWILHTFFKIRHMRESIRLYPISMDITRQQIETLHEQYNAVPVGQPLPEEITTYYYCPYHKRLLAPRVGSDCGKKGYVNTRAIGPEQVSVDPLTDQKFCTIQTGRSGGRRCIIQDIIPEEEKEKGVRSIPRTIQKIIPDPVQDITGIDVDDIEPDEMSESDEENDEDDEKQESMLDETSNDEKKTPPRKRRKKTDEQKGGATSGSSVASGSSSSIPTGVSKSTESTLPSSKNAKAKTKKKKYSKCAFEPLRAINLLGKVFMLYRNLYILCPQCGRAMKLTREKWCEIGLWCGCCIQGREKLCKKLAIPWDPVKKQPNYFVFPDKIDDIPVVVDPPRCVYCKKQKTPSRPLTFFLIYNDLDIEGDRAFRFGYYPFCRSHSKWYIGRSADSMRLSNIIYCLKLASECTSQSELRKISPRWILSSNNAAKKGESNVAIESIVMPTILYGIQDVSDQTLSKAEMGLYEKRKKNRRLKRKIAHVIEHTSTNTNG